MTNPFVHIEIRSRNVVECQQFYGSLFGWKFQHDPKMNYYTIDTGKEPGGGMFQHDQMPPGVTVYVGVDDVDRALQKAQSLGGTILQPKMEIPGVGWWGLFADLEGTSLAVFQGLPQPPKPRRRPAARPASRRKKAARRRRK